MSAAGVTHTVSVFTLLDSTFTRNFHNANYVQRTEAHKDNRLVVDVSTLYGSDIVSDHSCDVNGSQ